MSEAVRTGFLIRGTKEKSEGDVFLRTSFAPNSHLDGFAGRLSLLHTAVQIPCSFGANIPIQYGNRGLNGLNHCQFSRIFGHISTKNRCQIYWKAPDPPFRGGCVLRTPASLT